MSLRFNVGRVIKAAPVPARVLPPAIAPAARRAGLAGPYPAPYAAIVAAARSEGKAVVYSTTDISVVAA